MRIKIIKKYSKTKDIKYKVTSTGCHEVTSLYPQKKAGYFQIKRLGCEWTLSRLIFYIYKGYLPKVVMHTCDNPKCINPEHLKGGTFKDNSVDMVSKNRQARGERNGGGVKLNPEKVKEIKSKLIQGKSLMSLAKEYHVSKKTILNIKQNKKWKYIQI
jgi:hypothetical protein